MEQRDKKWIDVALHEIFGNGFTLSIRKNTATVTIATPSINLTELKFVANIIGHENIMVYLDDHHNMCMNFEV
jgi:hypothetical protein